MSLLVKAGSKVADALTTLADRRGTKTVVQWATSRIPRALAIYRAALLLTKLVRDSFFSPLAGQNMRGAVEGTWTQRTPPRGPCVVVFDWEMRAGSLGQRTRHCAPTSCRNINFLQGIAPLF